MKSFIFATDLHGDHQDHASVEALLKFCDIFNPDVRIFGGDLFDFRNIRRGAGVAEKQDSMSADVEAGMEFLSKFKPNVFLLGNHDKRLWDTANFSEHGMISDAAKMGIKDIEKKCRSIKCKILPYVSNKGVYQIGKVRFIHGYHAGVYATKKHAEIYAPSNGIVLHGHTHAIQYHSVARLNGGCGMSVGCLANLDMEYNAHQTGRMLHAHGFAYGYAEKDDWQVFQAKEGANGKWVVAKELMTL
jgi:predicted MPP superfamily phosphohydrolase